MTEFQVEAPKLDHRSVELRSLIETSQILNASLDVNNVLNNCLLTIMGRMVISRAMALVAAEENHFVVKVIKSLPQDVELTQFNFACEFRTPVILHEMNDQQCRSRSFLLSLGIELLIPMMSRDRMVGVICLGGKMTGESFTNRELEFLNSMSNIAATAVENALNFQKLEALNRRLDKKVQELNTLFDVGKELNATLDKQHILSILQFTILGEMAANKMIIFIFENGRFNLKISNWPEDDKIEIAMMRPAVGELFLAQKEPIHLRDEDCPRRFRYFLKFGVKVIVPMRIQDATQGVLFLGSKLSGFSYLGEDLEFLSTLSNRVMISWENARLFEETLEKHRMDEEIAIAKEIQQRLLPRSFPQSDQVELFGLNLPSRQVGGDYYDVIPLAGHRFALAIGDVSGKGVGASLLMSTLHAGLHTLIQSQAPISEVIGRLNDLIYQNTNYDKFITFFYAEFDPSSFTLDFVNAGHIPPYVCHRDGSLSTLDVGGLILGMMPNISYEVGHVTLQAGDLLIAVTDGVTEAFNVSDEMFDDERLKNLILDAQRDDVSLKKFAEHLILSLQDFSKGMPQADDITFLGLKLNSCIAHGSE
ncbi:MAG: hypothetical protein EHM72_03990 [Calditrichaeota bacterium]|nr:MAG: hypothetical protein EHM72_03990 [Calditrichota bacterium]